MGTAGCSIFEPLQGLSTSESCSYLAPPCSFSTPHSHLGSVPHLPHSMLHGNLFCPRTNNLTKGHPGTAAYGPAGLLSSTVHSLLLKTFQMPFLTYLQVLFLHLFHQSFFPSISKPWPSQGSALGHLLPETHIPWASSPLPNSTMPTSHPFPPCRTHDSHSKYRWMPHTLLPTYSRWNPSSCLTFL